MLTIDMATLERIDQPDPNYCSVQMGEVPAASVCALPPATFPAGTLTVAAEATARMGKILDEHPEIREGFAQEVVRLATDTLSRSYWQEQARMAQRHADMFRQAARMAEKALEDGDVAAALAFVRGALVADAEATSATRRAA